MSGLYADTTMTVMGGAFTAAPEPDDGEHACDGCAGYGLRPLCEALPGCGADQIIWVAHDDPATITLLATLALEAS
jgi:hypothetical protein